MKNKININKELNKNKSAIKSDCVRLGKDRKSFKADFKPIQNKQFKGERICYSCGCRISVSKHYIGSVNRIKYISSINGIYLNGKWVCNVCYNHLFKDRFDGLFLKSLLLLNNKKIDLNTNYYYNR